MPIHRGGEKADSGLHPGNMLAQPSSARVGLETARLTRSLYYRWQKRLALGALEDRTPAPVDLYQALPEEEEAVVSFALQHRQDGYRRLTWMMVDQDVVY